MDFDPFVLKSMPAAICSDEALFARALQVAAMPQDLRVWMYARDVMENHDGHRYRKDGISKISGSKKFLEVVEKISLALKLDYFSMHQKIKLSQFEVCHPRIPESLDGFRMVWISDLHMDVGNYGGRMTKKICNLVAGSRPDLLIYGGDYRHGDSGELSVGEAMLFPEIGKITNAVQARETVALIGNHDVAEMIYYFREMGAKPMINRGFTIGSPDNGIHIFGTDDTYRFFQPETVDKMRAAVQPGAFNLLLSHGPHLAEEAAAAGYQFYLTGHTHGGQVDYHRSLHWVRDCLYAQQDAGDQLKGLWGLGEMMGYTNAGVGASSLPFRNVPGEVSEVTLRHAAQPEVRAACKIG